MLKRRSSKIWYGAIGVVLFFTVIWTLFPMYWMLLTSFKKDMDVFDIVPSLWPEYINIENYTDLMTGENPIYVYFLNSV